MLAFPSLCTPVSSYREMAIKENLNDLSDLALEEREAREEMNYLKSHLDFDEDKQKDDDLYFVQGDDYEIKNRKRWEFYCICDNLSSSAHVAETFRGPFPRTRDNFETTEDELKWLLRWIQQSVKLSPQSVYMQTEKGQATNLMCSPVQFNWKIQAFYKRLYPAFYAAFTPLLPILHYAFTAIKRYWSGNYVKKPRRLRQR